MKSTKYVKLVVYVPSEAAVRVRQVLAKLGCGRIGNYDACSFSIKGIGRFRPNEKANPYIGQVGEIVEVEEERIETILEYEKLHEVLLELKQVHPYEEPAVDIFPLLDT